MVVLRHHRRERAMPHVMDKLYWYETDQMCGRPPTPQQLVDVEDAGLVLDFTYRYLEAAER
jgi:hypothetical protein